MNLQPMPGPLRDQGLWVSTAGALILAGGCLVLARAWGVPQLLRWAALAVPVTGYVLAILWRNLSFNRRPGDTDLFHDLGAATWATCLRGLLLAVLAGFLLLPRPTGTPLAWAPAILYTLAVISDLFDGILARAAGRETELGNRLDMAFDSLGVLIASALVVHYGQMPWPYLGVGLLRYVYAGSLWWRDRRGLPTCDLTPRIIGRMAAGLHMAFVSVILWPVFGPPATVAAGVCFVLPLLASFTRDWLVVTCIVDPASTAYRTLARAATWLAYWGAPVLRVTAAALAARWLLPLASNPAARAVYEAAAMGALATGVGLVGGLAGLLLALGVGSRLAALGMLAAVCTDLAVRGFQPAHGVLLVATIGVLYLGSGAFALWRRDDWLFTRKLG